MRIIIHSMLAVLATVILSGCSGYRVGSLGHPQLSAIGIGDVRNDTREPRAATYLKMKLPAAFMSDGSVGVVDRDEADAVLHTRIISTTIGSKGGTEITEGDDAQQVFRSTIFSLQVQVAYQVTRRGRETPLIAEQTVRGEATFTEELDLTVTRQKALEVALADAAEKVVRGVTEAW